MSEASNGQEVRQYDLPPREPAPEDGSSTVIVIAAAVIVVIAVLSPVLIIAFAPQSDVLPLTITIFGFATASIAALLAILRVGAVQKDVKQLDIRVDGRLTNLLDTATKAAAAEATTVAERVAAEKAAFIAAAAIKEARDAAMAIALATPPPAPAEPDDSAEK